MRRLAVLLAASAVLAAGCGHPLIPTAVLNAARAPHRAIAPLRDPTLGVDLYALSNLPAAQVQADGTRTLGYLRHTLGATAVGIVWNFYAPSRTADTVATTGATLSAASVAILTRIAHRDHLQVEYRPLIMVPSQPNHWEGLISPARPARWLDSYYHAELPYLRDAQRLRVSEFVAETEMHYLNASPLWPGYIARLSRVYHGDVSYAAWDYDYFPPRGQLIPTPYLGMDMYLRLPLRPAAPYARVARAFSAAFGSMPASVLRRTAIQETGIEARAGAYADPANLMAPGRLDQAVQAYWYTADCQAVRQFHLRGVFFWKVDLTDYPAHPATSLSTFEGRAGAVAIRHCAAILR